MTAAGAFMRSKASLRSKPSTTNRCSSVINCSVLGTVCQPLHSLRQPPLASPCNRSAAVPSVRSASVDAHTRSAAAAHPPPSVARSLKAKLTH